MAITYVGFAVQMNGLNLMSTVDMEALRRSLVAALRSVHPASPGSDFSDAVVVSTIEHAGRGMDEED